MTGPTHGRFLEKTRRNVANALFQVNYEAKCRKKVFIQFAIHKIFEMFPQWEIKLDEINFMEKFQHGRLVMKLKKKKNKNKLVDLGTAAAILFHFSQFSTGGCVTSFVWQSSTFPQTYIVAKH